MDRIMYNESLVIFTVLQLMIHNIKEVARLDLLTVLCIDAAIRKRLPVYQAYSPFVHKECEFSITLNSKFNDCQVVIINALTMMLMTGVIENSTKSNVEITAKGVEMANDIFSASMDILNEIRNAVNQVSILVDNVETKQLYKDLKIVL